MLYVNLCLIGFALVMGMIGVNLSCDVKEEHEQFMATLTPHQLDMYKQVVQERKNAFMVSTLAGLLVAVIFSFVMKKQLKSSRFGASCAFLSIAVIVQYFVYSLYPKSKFIVESLTTPQQLKEWAESYQAYKRAYHLGLLLGIFGYAAIGYSL